MNILISIIVPIYNVELYLRKCINSIRNQTYKNIEIILVDDGSPDNCGKICDEYKQKDNRIKVIHKKNGGLSEARNYGIEIATGDYILFVDSDDYIANNMCQILLKKAEKYKADIINCSFKEVFEDETYQLSKQLINTKEQVFSNLEMIESYFFDITINTNVVWNKLYARKLFFGEHKIRFPVGKLHEDNYTVYKLYYYANKVVVIDDVLYYYLRRSDSITGNPSDKNVIDKLEAGIDEFAFANDINDQVLKSMVFAHSLNSYMGLINDTSIDIKNVNIRNKLQEYKLCILNNANISKNSYIDYKRYIKYFIMKFNLEKIYSLLLKIKRNNI